MCKDRENSIFFTDKIDEGSTTFERDFAKTLEYQLVKEKTTVKERDVYVAISTAIRHRMIRNWLRTQHAYRENKVKRVYYLSMEFLMGRLLGNTLINLDFYDEVSEQVEKLGYHLEDIRDLEPDMGLGNGGLGRLAACFLDSMATLALPAYGYGIRYEYGIFRQGIKNGYQVEVPDNWLKYGCPWEICRPELEYRVQFGGKVITEKDGSGVQRYRWVDTEDVLALAYDVPVPGYKNNTVNNLRLWQAKSTNEFDFQYLTAVTIWRLSRIRIFPKISRKFSIPTTICMKEKFSGSNSSTSSSQQLCRILLSTIRKTTARVLRTFRKRLQFSLTTLIQALEFLN